VLKHELLWDPSLDLVGHRIPNAFVRRGSGDSAREAARVAALADDLGPRDAVVLYPEGTRFSPARRDRALEALAREDPARHARVQSLRSVLPVRPGGVLALLARAPAADVLFCVHRGWEATASLGALVRGAMRGARVDVLLWRVPAAEVPREPEAALRWLDAQWARADAWLAAG
jgi:1-acyl-sn-glycerol-3-phosphate acyltransferase